MKWETSGDTWESSAARVSRVKWETSGDKWGVECEIMRPEYPE